MANPFEGCSDEEQESSEALKEDKIYFKEESEVKIMEGLICPACMSKFNTEKDLLSHFNKDHKGETPPKLGTSLKGILGRAKKKIFETSDDTNLKEANEPDFDEYWRKNQPLGCLRSHWNVFKKRRESKIEDYVIETNKLLIILDKLLREVPLMKDLEKRKEHEKSIVDWVEDSFVKLCPQCAKIFNFFRRKHHCRLCGGIMCHPCSQFLEHSYANQLVSPIDLETSQLLSNSSQFSSSSLHTPSLKSSSSSSSLQRKASIMSLPAISNISNDHSIRVCKDCKNLLDRRNKQMFEQHTKPIICQLYEHLKNDIEEADNLFKQYFRLLDSLRDGEGNFNVQKEHAEEVRMKLITLGENIDIISRKINTLGLKSDVPIDDYQRQLQSRIRSAATNYLKENIIRLPSIPTQQEIEEMREQAQFNIDINLPEINSRPCNNLRSKSDVSSKEPISTDGGWTPEVKAKARKDIDEMDPMLIQIERIKEFIDLARKANKYDEAYLLESNLRELEVEYMMQSIPEKSSTGID